MIDIDKIEEYSLMKKSPSLAPHLPETVSFGERQFARMLNKYGDIVVKPNEGSRGRNVIRVFSSENGLYTIHHEAEKISLQGITNAYLAVLSNIAGRGKYIVQRRIPLATVNGRPFDVRVIMQRKIRSNKWIVTGKVAKLAGKGYIVTNLTRSHGKALKVSNAIQRSSIKQGLRKGLISKLNAPALNSVYIMERIFPKDRIFGMDLGIDNNGHIWLIEANRFPAMSHFRKLGNKTIIRRIMKFKHGK